MDVRFRECQCEQTDYESFINLQNSIHDKQLRKSATLKLPTGINMLTSIQQIEISQ